MKLNKKAQATAVYGLFAILLIFALLVIYWYFFVIPTANITPSKESLVAQEKLNYDILLLNYLKTPVTVNENEIFMSDLIRLYRKDASYKEKLKEESLKIFDKTMDKKYSLEIDGDKLIGELEKSEGSIISQTQIPGNENIVLELRI